MILRSGVIILFLWLQATALYAATYLPVVAEYGKAAEPKAWTTRAHRFEDHNPIPYSFVRYLEVSNPSRAFKAPYPAVFLQNERVVVCDRKCDQKQSVAPVRRSGGFEVRLSKVGTKKAHRFNQSLIRQATVYYWVNRWPLAFPGEKLVGYQTQTRSGVVKTTLLEQIAE